MKSKKEATKTLHKLMRRTSAVDLEMLFDVLGTSSRMTVFRKLQQVGYLSSFTHGGKYYTLEGTPSFDDNGFWFHGDIGFSRAGTLKQSAVSLVEKSPDGHTHEELQRLLRVRVHNTLLELVREKRIGREQLVRVYLYVSADPERAARQVKERREIMELLAVVLRVPTDEEVVEVLVEALRAAPEVPETTVVAKRLVARGIHLEPHNVEQVYEAHGLMPGKKTAPHSSRRSRH